MLNKKPLVLAIVGALTSASVFASSHREAPNITKYPKVDSTDYYIFNSYEEGRGDYVTMIANYIPLQDPYGGPNYFSMDQFAEYAIHIDNNGDAVEDISFTFKFARELGAGGEGIALPVGTGENEKMIKVPLKNVGGISTGDNAASVNFFESYTIEMVSGSMQNGQRTAIAPSSTETFAKPMDYVGNKTFTDKAGYEAYAAQFIYEFAVPGCEGSGKVFVGQRKDSFVVNLGKTFDLVNYVPVDGESFPGGIMQNSANDDLADKNVTSIAVEVPKACITGEGNGVVGSWTTASLPQARVLNPNASFDKPEVNGGAMTQVSRLGNPLVNEVVIGLEDKDLFSTAHPTQDAALADYVTHPVLPEILNILFKEPVNTTLGTDFETIAPTNIPRTDLVAAFLTGIEGVNQQSEVTASEMIRLNTAIEATAAADQSALGVAGDDLAGFPNGRRPGDDVVDIALRVVMGALCHDVPVNGEPTNLGFCAPEDAPVGAAAFTDGAPIDASLFDNAFPYVTTPLPGSQ